MRLALLVSIAILAAGCATRGAGGERGTREKGTRIDRWRPRVKLGAEFKASANSDLDQLLFNELIGLDIDGQVYHERFLKFSVGGDLAWTQADIFNDQSSMENAFIPGYRANLDFLPEHVVSVSLFALLDQERTIIPTSTLSSFIAVKDQQQGGRVNLRLKNLMGSLLVRNWDRTTLSTLLARRERRDTIQTVLSHRIPGSQTRVTYGWDDVLEEPTSQVFKLTTFDFSSLLRDGPAANPNATLRTTFTLRDREGTSAFSSTDFFTEATLWFIPRFFSSATRFQLSSLETTTRSRTRIAGQRFVHRLYQSLETTLDLFTEKTTTDGGLIERSGGSLDFAYLKQTSFGAVQLGYQFGALSQSNQGASTVPVRDEPHQLSISTVSLLANPNVISSSVSVTDVTGTILYVENLDYQLISRGAFTEIARTPTGNIPDGGAVLVDYEYSVPGDVAFDQQNHRALAQLNFENGLRLYARYNRIRNKVRRGDPGNSLEDLDSWTVGVEYQKHGIRAAAAYLDHRSSLTPFRQSRLEFQYLHELDRRVRLAFGVTDLRTFFSEGGDLATNTFNLQLRVNLPPRFNLLLEPAYRIETGRGSDRDLITIRLQAEYRLGKIRFRLQALHEVGELNSRGIGQTFVSFYAERKW